MDILGAQCLAARIRAGVRIGSHIELIDSVGSDSSLVAGDRGEVRGFTAEGYVLVAFESQFQPVEIDPRMTHYRSVAA
ncbi:hypothetical protein [Gaiella sp.]|uniref:hypothetical protein n=1 Tax=Gaiella sp. TaxID=2663207 RepID=UPI003983DA9D